MSTTAFRSLFRVDDATWRLLLSIGVWFLIVAGVAHALAGSVVAAVLDAVSALVFHAVARAVTLPEGRARTVVSVAAVLLVVVRVAHLARGAAAFVAALPTAPHPAVMVVLAMSGALQVCVVLMTLESLRRLTQGVPAAG